MHVVQVTRARPVSGTYLLAARDGVLGTLLVLGALATAAVALGTPLVSELGSQGARRFGVGALAAIIVWAIAFLTPGVLGVFGVVRLAAAFERARLLRERPSPLASVADRLSNEYTVARSVRLPDGTTVPEVVVGPHGVAVIAPLPPARATRHRGQSWEVRVTGGEWRIIENPFDRVLRDAERLRRWLALSIEDVSIRVHAAVVTDGHSGVQRERGVAVVTRDQLPAYLASIPQTRHLTPHRRARVIELLQRAS